MTYTQDLADTLKSLETFASVPAKESVSPFLANWAFDQGDQVPFLLISQPLNMRLPTSRKFWRRLEFFGDGTIHAIVFSDGLHLATGHAVMTANPSGHRFINLPRGAKGFELTVVMAVMGKLDGMMCHYDPVGMEQAGE